MVITPASLRENLGVVWRLISEISEPRLGDAHVAKYVKSWAYLFTPPQGGGKEGRGEIAKLRPLSP